MLSISDAELDVAREWASDCLSLPRGQRVSPARAVAYVERNYPGGWDAFTVECVATAVQL